MEENNAMPAMTHIMHTYGIIKKCMTLLHIYCNVYNE